MTHYEIKILFQSTILDLPKLTMYVVVNQNHIQNHFTCCQIPVNVSQISLGSDDHHVVCIKSYPRGKDTTMRFCFEWY